MMEESRHGEFRLSSLGHGHHKSRRAVRLPRTVYVTLVHTFYPALRHRSTRLASLDVPITYTTRRAKNRHIALLAAIRLIVAAVRRRRRERARSRQQLRELSDHTLRDIGLRREDIGYEFPKPFWHD
jgi:uncharacterized protein YjiS (DUF1127 family)